MSNRDGDAHPAGRPPWDTWNGVRVGLLGGGLIGVLMVALSGTDAYWAALISAAVGAVIGYRSERRKRFDQAR
jgi:predicted lipid-binding transport protein (Tim44 family)